MRIQCGSGSETLPPPFTTNLILTQLGQESQEIINHTGITSNINCPPVMTLKSQHKERLTLGTNFGCLVVGGCASGGAGGEGGGGGASGLLLGSGAAVAAADAAAVAARSRLGVLLCTFLRWSRSLSFRLNSLPHSAQLNSRHSEWRTMCSFSFTLLPKLFSHSWQLYLQFFVPLNQGCGSGTGLDPDPDWIRIQ
jgi:hypothetical protein